MGFFVCLFVFFPLFLKVSSYRLYDNLPLVSRRAAMQQEIPSGGGRVGVELAGLLQRGEEMGQRQETKCGRVTVGDGG